MKLVSRVLQGPLDSRIIPVCMILLCAGVASIVLGYLGPSNPSSSRPPAVTVRNTPLTLWGTDRFEVELPADRLHYALTRIAKHEFHSWNQVTHALRLWGMKVDRLGDWDGKRMLQILCSAEEAQKAFRFAPHLLNRNGLQFGHRFVDGRLQGEKHLNESISILGESGVSGDQQIVVWDHVTTVADAVQAAAVNCDLDQELEFSVALFAHYLPPQKAWTNKFGQVIDFDLLCDRLCNKKMGTGGCGGTHILSSLALVLAADRQHAILTDVSRQKIHAKLIQAYELLQTTQREDGTWDATWFDPNAARIDDFSSTVMVTGHTLEWLAIAPQDIVKDQEMVSHACEGVLGLFMKAPPAQFVEEFNYYTHLANALKLWSPQRWSVASRSARND